MDRSSHALSVELLRQVLDGVSVDRAAHTAGISASAAEQRIKQLARRLQTTVGVERVDETARPTTKLLRAHRLEYIEALSHYEPDRMPRPDRSATGNDLRLILERIGQHNRQQERDTALALLLFATAVRPAELLRLEVRDYLTPSGASRLRSVVRAEIATDRRERPLFFTSMRLRQALDTYLALRKPHRRSVADCAYRGLDGCSPLLLANPEPCAQHFTPAKLNETLRRIFHLSGRPSLTALSVRRYVANRLAAMCVDERDIAQALGVRNVESVRAMLDRTSLEDAMRRLV